MLAHLLPAIKGGNRARAAKHQRNAPGLSGTYPEAEHAEDATGHGTDWDVLVAHFLGVDHVGHR